MGKYSGILLSGSDDAQESGANYSDALLSGAPSQEAAEPQQESWGQWLKNSVAGRADPKYGALPSVYSQFTDSLKSPTATAATLGASDAQMADVVQSKLGDRFVRREQDANGYEVFVTRGPDGKEQKGYLNRPGLDAEDIWRGVYGAAPYVLSGGAIGAATKGAGIGVQALAQGSGAALTSAAGDVGQMPLGSEQGIEVGKAGFMGALGLVGPPAAAAAGGLWRRFVTIPGLIDRSSGQLTAKGLAAAKQAGIDPADITPDFARRFSQVFAESGDAAQAATQSQLDKYGIPATRGQVTKDPYLLTQEEGMRRRLYGEQAQDIMRGFDERQKDAIRYGALGGDRSAVSAGSMSPSRGIGNQIAPHRSPGEFPSDIQPGTLGESAQSAFQAARNGARRAESEAWQGTSGLEATPEAFDVLPNILSKRLDDVVVDTATTPAAASMAKELDRFVSGEAPDAVASVLRREPVKTVDQMRRRLLKIQQSAGTAEDARAAGALYDGFNEWISEAARMNLLNGDPEVAMKIAAARGFTREVRALFEPKDASGRLSPSGHRLAKILDGAKADSGEAVITSLFGSHGSRGINTGTVSALKNFKSALDRFAPKADAGNAWNDVRLAFWARLVTNKGGEMLGPQAIAGNIKQAFHTQNSVLETLYKPQELREMRTFLRAIESVAYKPPNASGSGYTAASFMKDGIVKFLDAFGLGRYLDAAVTYTGIGNALNTAAARQAASAAGRPIRPNLTPAVTGAGQSFNRD